MGSMIDLGGSWTLGCPEWNGRTIAAELPGDNYSALLAAGMIPDPYFGRNDGACSGVPPVRVGVYARIRSSGGAAFGRRYVYLNCRDVRHVRNRAGSTGRRRVSTREHVRLLASGGQGAAEAPACNTDPHPLQVIRARGEEGGCRDAVPDSDELRAARSRT